MQQVSHVKKKKKKKKMSHEIDGINRWDQVAIGNRFTWIFSRMMILGAGSNLSSCTLSNPCMHSEHPGKTDYGKYVNADAV